MQQAVLADIALSLPIGFIAWGTGFEVPQGLTELGSSAVSGAVLLAVACASVSSALGITPDKIPFLSRAFKDHMQTIDTVD
jgi:hypothetical protein